eukprot:scaffold291728_cov28-Tisochrysis_lutea.AAC.3
MSCRCFPASDCYAEFIDLSSSFFRKPAPSSLALRPNAQPANRAVTCGEHLPGETASDERRSTSDASRPRYLVLRHTHKSTKQQHYELYSLISGNALLEEEDLPAGVKRAFAHVCPGGDLWRQLQTAQGDD